MADCVVAQFMGKKTATYTVAAAVAELLIAVFLQSWAVAIGGFLVVIGVSTLMRYHFLPHRLLRLMQSRPDLLEERTIALEPGEIREQAATSPRVFARRDLQRAILNRTHLFLVFRPHALVMLPLAWIPRETRLEDVAAFLAKQDEA